MHEILTCQGCFMSLEAAESSMCRDLPDVAFVRIGKTELNAFRLQMLFER